MALPIKPPFDPDAPLVLRFAALGDVVLLTVLLAALHQRYGRPVQIGRAHV